MVCLGTLQKGTQPPAQAVCVLCEVCAIGRQTNLKYCL